MDSTILADVKESSTVATSRWLHTYKQVVIPPPPPPPPPHLGTNPSSLPLLPWASDPSSPAPPPPPPPPPLPPLPSQCRTPCRLLWLHSKFVHTICHYPQTNAYTCLDITLFHPSICPLLFRSLDQCTPGASGPLPTLHSQLPQLTPHPPFTYHKLNSNSIQFKNVYCPTNTMAQVKTHTYRHVHTHMYTYRHVCIYIHIHAYKQIHT